MLKKLFVIAAAFAISSCGGGGGSSSGGSGGGGSANTNFPTSLSKSIPENERLTAEFNFKYYAPSDTAPQNLTLSGPDQKFFEVVIEVTPANSVGDRDVKLGVYPLDVFREPPHLDSPFRNASPNYEQPLDANKDNVFEFTISGTYQGKSLNTNIKLTVTDVLDNAEVSVADFALNTSSRVFIVEVPDITGDGRNELGLSPRFTSSGNAPAYIISSEALERPAGEYLLSDNTNYLSKFGPWTSSTNSNEDLNVLSVASAGNGSSKLVVSKGFEDKASVFPIQSGGLSPDLTGEVVLDVSSNSVSVFEGNRPRNVLVKAIEDINGDGITDYFVRYARITHIVETRDDGNPQTSGPDRYFSEYGIIFGEDPAQPVYNTDFDIQFLYEDSSGWNEFEKVTFEQIEDINGDDVADWILLDYGLTYLNGSIFTDPSLTQLDLESLTAEQGHRVNIPVKDVSFTTALSETGEKHILLTTTPNSSSGYTYGFKAENFAANINDFYNQEDFTFSGEDSMIELPDFDGDGISEFLTSDFFGYYIMTGAQLRASIASGAEIPRQDRFQIKFQPTDAGDKERANRSSRRLYLKDSNKLVFAYDCNFSTSVNCGGVIILDTQALQDAITAGSTMLIVHY